MVTALFISIHLLVPIMGLIWLAQRRERINQQRILNDNLKALKLVRLGRGRH